MSFRRHLAKVLLAVAVATPGRVTAQAAPPRSTAATRAQVSRLLSGLSLRQQVAQLVMPWLAGSYAAFDDTTLAKARGWIDSLRIGGIVISIGSPLDIAAKLNFLQRRSKLPLLIASDLEGGTSFRFNGGTPFPTNMGVGATGSERAAYVMGRITAREGRAAGIHLTFSPVADVNNNPANPIINTRSFGGEPHAVARLVAATVRGIQDGGMLATAKHFPGHGDTDTDSHLALPVIRADWRRLDSLELVPFRAAIAAGVQVVMSAHIALPELERGQAVPATLAPEILTGVLRDSLGFKGMIVTDALDMGALVNSYGPGESAVKAFLAGSDLLLMPVDPRGAIDAMEDAVRSGRISRARLDASVRRVLEVKVRLGLLNRRTVNLDSLGYVVGRRAHRDTALAVSRGALVLVRDSLGLLDSLRASPRRLALISYADAQAPLVGGTLQARLSERGYLISPFRLSAASGPASYDSAAAVARSAPQTLVVTSIRVVSGRGAIGLPAPLASLIDATARERPTGLVSFGTPYLLSEAPSVALYLLAWTDNPLTEEAVAGALSGEAISGRLPIDLPSGYPWGWGLPKAGHAPLCTMQPCALAPLTALLDSAVSAGAAPGAVLAVSFQGNRFVYGTGRLALDDPTRPDGQTVYDLASLTKVVATTTLAMLAVSEGKLRLDAPVQRYLPAFRGAGKERVTIRHLLTHSSGLPADRPLWRETPDADSALRLVNATPLAPAPGARMVYSDLGAIVLGEVIERVYGDRLDRLAERRIFAPLGMGSTRFRPPAAWLPRIAPTEYDSAWRKRIVRGEVHDEKAAWLGGVAGHAGLFADAMDLLQFGEWLGGVAAPDSLRGNGGSAALPIKASVVREFSTRQNLVPGSSRALGWDTPESGNSAGTRLGPKSFGHTGFTGTSIWIDPTRQLVIVLLTNRVHPTRNNPRIGPLRIAVADRVVELLERGKPR
ncbi:MAG TPA: glycoside hydrolase family 3 N-terminal domain-containing protein [Gemmatimonadales bacterium]|nr:glycoside hydrolase family 3 N-terminal domain-containing protein [Gemmatimonadales bacterium]